MTTLHAINAALTAAASDEARDDNGRWTSGGGEPKGKLRGFLMSTGGKDNAKPQRQHVDKANKLGLFTNPEKQTAALRDAAAAGGDVRQGNSHTSVSDGLKNIGKFEGRSSSDFVKAMGRGPISTSSIGNKSLLQWHSGRYNRQSVAVLFGPDDKFIKITHRYGA